MMRARGLGHALALGLLLGAAACADDPRPAPPPPASTFVADLPEPGASVFLRSLPGANTAERIVVEVVARGAPELHGAAFRLTWDAAALELVTAEVGEAFSKQALALAKEAAPGQLAVVWAEKGEKALDASGETILGTLTFARRGRSGSVLAFRKDRSQVVDKKGAPVVTSWRGGSVSPR